MKTWEKLGLVVGSLGTIATVISIILFLFGNNGVHVSQTGNITNINSPQITGNVYGNIEINMNEGTENIDCPQCPDTEFDEVTISHEYKIGFEEGQIEVDMNNVKIPFPDGQELFFDKLVYNKSLVFGVCDNDISDCYIFPEYRFDQNDDVCMEIDMTNFTCGNINDINLDCYNIYNTSIDLGNSIKKVGLNNHFTHSCVKNGIRVAANINLYRTKMTLPNGQIVYFDKFMQDETIIFAYCNHERTDCYIFPEYRFEKDDEVCLETKLNDDWGGSGFTILENRGSCIEDADTNTLLDLTGCD